MRPEDDIIEKLKELCGRADDMNMLKEDRATIRMAIINIVSHRQREKMLRAFQPLKASKPRVKMHSGLKRDR